MTEQETNACDPPNDDKAADAPPRPRWRGWALWIAALALGLAAWNATVMLPVASGLSGENSHTLIAYRRWLISPTDIVLDVRDVDAGSSMADMDRLLFKAAEALKDRDYDAVVLAFHGRGRFILDGSRFKSVGQEYSYQNPIYTIRTLTEKVTDMEGNPAFGTWTGGWLGVLGQQMNDHNEFHQKWWVRPEMGLD